MALIRDFCVPCVLALDAATEEVMGVAHQEPFLRQPAPKGETARQRQERAREKPRLGTSGAEHRNATPRCAVDSCRGSL